jgi:hypothetical protein
MLEHMERPVDKRSARVETALAFDVMSGTDIYCLIIQATLNLTEVSPLNSSPAPHREIILQPVSAHRTLAFQRASFHPRHSF